MSVLSSAWTATRQAYATARNAPLFRGIKFNDGTDLDVVASGLQEYALKSTAQLVISDSHFLAEQRNIQNILDAQKNALKSELGIVDSDFIDLPILFHEAIPNRLPGRYIALNPGSVNMLVVTNSPSNIDLVIPKPFGPVIGGQCMFEASITASFASNSAVNVHFIDTFLTYHIMQGEVHCGTNSKRIPPSTKWWH